MAGYLIAGRLVEGGGYDAGEITVRALIPNGMSVDAALNDAGSIDVDVNLPLVDPFTKSTIHLPSVIVPGRDFLGYVENDVILEAGPVMGDPFTFPFTSRIVANGLWSYFDRRFILPPLDDGELPRDVTSTWEDLSLGTIAKKIVQQACSWEGANLPIDFPANVSGTHEREHPGSDMKRVGDALRDLCEVEGGPDIRFRPVWGEDRKHVRWLFETGTPELTQAPSPDHYWDVSVPDPHAALDSLDRDGSELSSRDYQIGATFNNKLPNSTFDDNVDGWIPGGSNGTLTRITKVGSSPIPGVTTASRTTWSGASGSGSGGAYFNAGVTCEPGKRYTLTGYVSSNVSKQVQARFQWHDDDGDILSSSGGTAITVSSGWHFIRITAKAPANAVKMRPYVYPTSGNQWASGNTFTTLGWMLTESTMPLPFHRESVQLQATASSGALIGQGFPLYESMTSRTSVVVDTTLQGHADADVARLEKLTETFTISVRRDKFPLLGSYRPGDYALLRIGPNPRIPAGTRRVRIVRIGFSEAGDVTVVCAPERVAVRYTLVTASRNYLRNKLRDVNKRIDEAIRRK